MTNEEKQYIAMAGAAAQIQAKTPYKGWGSEAFFTNATNTFSFFGKKTPGGIRVTWLPSVDDFLDFIPGGQPKMIEALVLFSRDLWIGREYALQFTSFRQFVMAAVMWKVYARVWDGTAGKWVQKGISNKQST